MILNESFSEEYCKIASIQDHLNDLKKHLIAAKDKTTEAIQDNKEVIKKTLPFAVGGAAAIGTYAAMRRFKLSKNPMLAKLQTAAKGKKLVVHKDTKSKYDDLLYGSKVVTKPSEVSNKNVVFNYSAQIETLPGGTKINHGPLVEKMDDKLVFDRIINDNTRSKYRPTSITAKNTNHLEDALNAAGDEEGLKSMYPSGYVIKKRVSSMTSPTDLITDVNDPRVMSILDTPDTHLIQEKLPIDKEFRVHVLNGVPFSASSRRLGDGKLRKMWQRISGSRGGGAFVPATGKERKNLMEFVADAHKGNEGLENAVNQGSHFHMAYDVARLPDGTHRLIEANPTPGTFNNPIIARKFNRLVTGKWNRDVSAGAGAIAGTAAGGATYGGIKAHEAIAKKKERA